MKKIMDGNEAAAHVSYNFTEVAGIYPITPASPMAEFTDKWANEGRKNYFGTPVKVVEMESEAGAAGMVHGSLQVGCLTTTYTASQGLLLMIPNMYKMAGEMLPGVIHVAARSLATHALSIFGDHQDVYATRMTGFAILSSSSVQQVMDLTGVAHLSAIKGSIPFLHFFDGFRTSHELSKIDVIDSDKLKDLIDEKALEEFRNRALNPEKPVTRGTAQNEDIYFQATEVRNSFYDKIPDIVASYMDEINKITGRSYAPFQYYGSKNATKIIVAMGSVCESIREVVDYLQNKNMEVGLLEVHLYRPFSAKYFLKAIPKSVKKIAVLDRTKEAGSSGEPLYLDVLKTMKESESKVSVIGGRYGLSSKNTTPAMIKGVFDFLDSKDVHTNFTVGILDDVTYLSIPYDESFHLPKNYTEFLVYGYGSDGMVSACKDLMKITGSHTNAYVQGYFKYDSKKSGGITASHLRFGKKQIHSTYYVENASVLVCTKDTYLRKLKMLDYIENGGIFLLNTSKSDVEVWQMLTDYDKKILQKKKVKFYIVDANKIAKKNGLGSKISAIIEILIFKLGKIIDFEFAVKQIKDGIRLRFANKGGDLVTKNLKAIDEATSSIRLMKIPLVEIDSSEEEKRSVFDLIGAMEGEHIPVSHFLSSPDGTFDAGMSRFEKRNISSVAPCFKSENCISCNLCSLVCPHAVIRPFLLDEKEEMDVPESLKDDLLDFKLGDREYKYVVSASLPDCTGCSLCEKICPGKKGEKAIVMMDKDSLEKEGKDVEFEYLVHEVSEKDIPKNTVKGSQFATPKFEFSGACAGCGETPYLKLLTQLFGDRLMIANATGCSSIYGASAPSTPYSVAWANSLFEDNAEYGYGMKIADLQQKRRIVTLISENMDLVKNSEKAIYKAYMKEITMKTAKDLYDIVDSSRIPGFKQLKRFIMPRSVWMVGGDGWAYDIGYNGIDHVLANYENINILVLDTEVYSNTGGQASKSTRVGAVAKFASLGKKVAKKDLAKIALTYPHVYVATISLGANPAQAVKVMLEAEAYDGPSFIIAYAPCIAQGIIAGMKNSIEEEKIATSSGYFPIFHYNPMDESFKMDSKADFSKYSDFIGGEDRYRVLKNLSKDYKKVLEENKNNAISRYQYYQSLEETNKSLEE